MRLSRGDTLKSGTTVAEPAATSTSTEIIPSTDIPSIDINPSTDIIVTPSIDIITCKIPSTEEQPIQPLAEPIQPLAESESEAELLHWVGELFVGFESEVPLVPEGMEWIPGREQGEYQLVASLLQPPAESSPLQPRAESSPLQQIGGDDFAESQY